MRYSEDHKAKTRERVLRVAAEMGYRPDSLAQGLRRNHTRNLGVLFSLRRPFEVGLVEHMYPVAKRLGYTLLLGPFTPAREQDAVIDELLRYRCDGLIVVGPELHSRDLEPLAQLDLEPLQRVALALERANVGQMNLHGPHGYSRRRHPGLSRARRDRRAPLTHARPR